MKHFVYISILLTLLSCRKETVEPTNSTSTVTPIVTPIVTKNPDPVFKNYFQPSYFLKKSDVWIDYYKVASSNGINIH